MRLTFYTPYSHDLEKLREHRLKIVQDNVDCNPLSVLDILRGERCVSNEYTVRCLMVDRWFVLPKPSSIKRVCTSLESPFRTIWFQVIQLALQDAHSRRPCDEGLWRRDLQPGGERDKCTGQHHICADDALEFLYKLSELEWAAAGLTREALVYVTDKRFIDYTESSFVYVPD